MVTWTIIFICCAQLLSFSYLEHKNTDLIHTKLSKNMRFTPLQKFETLLLNRQYQACLTLLQQETIQIEHRHLQKIALQYATESDDHACKQDARVCLMFMQKMVHADKTISDQTRVKNHTEVVQTVAEIRGKTGQFFQAIAYGDQLRMRRIIHSEGKSVVNRALNGQRPIEQAISHKSMAALEILLENGATVTSEDHERTLSYASLLYSNFTEKDLCFLCPNTNTPLQKQGTALNQEIQDTLAIAERLEEYLQQQRQQEQPQRR